MDDRKAPDPAADHDELSPGLSAAAPPVTAVPELEPLPDGFILRGLAMLESGYFAAVMATGIVSIASRLLGLPLIADVLLVVTAVVFVVLATAYIARAVLFPRRFAQSLRMPSMAVSYFTVVAGINVLATALLAPGFWIVSLLLGLAALFIWGVLSYGLFCSIVLAGNRPLLREINGGWLVWVVGTQSIAVLATAISPKLPWPAIAEMFGAGAIMFWSVGVVLYLILVVIIFLRLFLIETTPAEMGPAYWILMGATAISVRSAAGILTVTGSDPTPLLTQMHPFVVGLSVVMWSFGSWFIPMLVLFGLWRYFVRRFPWNYEPKLWSVVFPLGMYTVASITLGQAIDFGFMPAVASVGVWVAIVAWAIVAVLFVTSVAGSLRGHRRNARP
jgi:tellurite resistance protein TehA-like permease